MENVTVRDLRNHGADVLRRVEGGESLVVTRDGVPVAELRPLPGHGVSAAELRRRWARLPVVDADRFRADLAAALDESL
jgi:prevent-host-death family protein